MAHNTHMWCPHAAVLTARSGERETLFSSTLSKRIVQVRHDRQTTRNCCPKKTKKQKNGKVETPAADPEPRTHCGTVVSHLAQALLVINASIGIQYLPMMCRNFGSIVQANNFLAPAATVGFISPQTHPFSPLLRYMRLRKVDRSSATPLHVAIR